MQVQCNKYNMNRNCFKLGEPWKYGVGGQLLFVEESNRFEWTNPTAIFDIDTNLALHLAVKYKSLLYNDINDQKNVFFSRQDYMPSVETFKENCQGGSHITIDLQVNKTTMESFYKFVVKILLFLASKNFATIEEKNIFESIYCVEVLSRFIIEDENLNNNNNNNINNKTKTKRRYSIRLWKSNQINNFTAVQYLSKIFSPELNSGEYNSDVLYFHSCLEKITSTINDICDTYINNGSVVKNKEYMLQKQKITRCVGQLDTILTTDEIKSLMTAVVDVPFKIKITTISNDPKD